MYAKVQQDCSMFQKKNSGHSIAKQYCHYNAVNYTEKRMNAQWSEWIDAV